MAALLNTSGGSFFGERISIKLAEGVKRGRVIGMCLITLAYSHRVLNMNGKAKERKFQYHSKLLAAQHIG